MLLSNSFDLVGANFQIDQELFETFLLAVRLFAPFFHPHCFIHLTPSNTASSWLQ
jgi:hypothetical protein